MERLLIAVCAAGFMLGLPQLASACLCGSTDAQGAFLGADTVFIGKVTKIVRTKEASVGLTVKESGTLEVMKVPRWDKDVDGARVVTLEISETLKGPAHQTVDILTSIYDNGGTCGINFRLGESYLVYAYERRHELSADQAKLPKDQWTREIHLKAAADKFNQRLPALQTNICARTAHMKWAKDDVDIIRRILKGETLPKEQPKAIRIIN